MSVAIAIVFVIAMLWALSVLERRQASSAERDMNHPQGPRERSRVHANTLLWTPRPRVRA